MPDPEPSKEQPGMTVEDVEVSELEPLEEEEGIEGAGEPSGGGTPGGFRAGSLGPAHYTPPGAARRRTWKPMVAAVALFLAAGWGIASVSIQLYVADSAEGEPMLLEGIVIDYDDYYDSNYAKITEVPGVEVTVDGMNVTAVSDAQGKFELKDVPGGRVTMRFYKRDWDLAVNTTVDTYLYRDYTGGSDRRPFTVKVRDLNLTATKPDAPFQPSIEARLLDWPTADTVSLDVLVSSFYGPLDGYTVMVGEQPGTYRMDFSYGETVNYTFLAPTGTGSYDALYMKVVPTVGDPLINGTRVPLTQHPYGAGGWKSTEFPDVATFVQGGNITQGSTRTLLIHSTGATECTYRAGGDWQPWTPMTDGEVRLPVLLFATAPADTYNVPVEVKARNGTSEGTVRTVNVLHDTSPPALTATVPVNATALFADILITAPDAQAFRYSLPGGGWSEWQLVAARALVPLPDARRPTTTVTMQAKDIAGNVAEAQVTATLTAIKGHDVDEYGRYVANLRVCVPLIIIGVIFSALGGWACWKRRRAGLAMLGSLGAMLASGFTIWGAIFAVVALAAITLSRDEFEESQASAARAAAAKEEAPEEK
jgi:hypothetical protein